MFTLGGCFLIASVYRKLFSHFQDIYITVLAMCHTNMISVSIGPSGVRALPLAAGINVGGHYKWHFFLLFSPGSLLILPEGVVVGFQIFAWAPN